MTTSALRITVRHGLAGLALLAGLAASPAFAQEADDPHDTTQLLTGRVSQILQRDLGVLKLKPDAASDDCVSALHELHKTQDQIAVEEKRTKYQDLPVARDVLDSNFEDAHQYCGTDAKRLCRASASDPKMAAACDALRKNDEDSDAPP